jgi:hypothetical protein
MSEENDGMSAQQDPYLFRTEREHDGFDFDFERECE